MPDVLSYTWNTFFIILTTQWSKYYHSHFTDEDTVSEKFGDLSKITQ